MTVLEALAILEAAVLECKKRDINTFEVKGCAYFFELYTWPKWVIPQFRYHVENENNLWKTKRDNSRRPRATFLGIRNCVRELIRMQMDALAFWIELRKNEVKIRVSLILNHLLKLQSCVNIKSMFMLCSL